MSRPSDREYEAFIGRDAAFYLRRFRRYDALGGSFQAGWHWPVVTFGPLWFLYRKLYVLALVAFFMMFLPYLNVLAWFVFPVIAPYAYYQRANKVIRGLKAAYPDRDITHLCRLHGGVNTWVIWLGLFAGVLALVAGFLLAGALGPMLHF